MPLEDVEGDIFFADEEYIVIQASCTAFKPSGICKQIVDIWPALNPYKGRRRLRYNWAVLEDRAEAGTIAPMESYGMKVIYMFGQYSHGLVGCKKDPVMPDGFVMDSSGDRLHYFKEGLEKISQMRPKPKSVAFPYKIGCQLLVANWKRYRDTIVIWAKQNPDISVAIYHNSR